MPFINAKVSVKVSEKQEEEIKTRLGKAISLIPGKSENWLMVAIEDDVHMYFRGDNSQPAAFVGVNIFGSPDRNAFSAMTAEVTAIFGDILGIAPDHMYIRYAASADWGWNGNNF